MMGTNACSLYPCHPWLISEIFGQKTIKKDQKTQITAKNLEKKAKNDKKSSKNAKFR